MAVSICWSGGKERERLAGELDLSDGVEKRTRIVAHADRFGLVMSELRAGPLIPAICSICARAARRCARRSPMFDPSAIAAFIGRNNRGVFSSGERADQSRRDRKFVAAGRRDQRSGRARSPETFRFARVGKFVTGAYFRLSTSCMS